MHALRAYVSSKSDVSTDKNSAENYMQGKNQFARFRILQTELGEHAIITCMSFILLGKAEVADTMITLLVTHSEVAGVILCLLYFCERF